MSSTKLWAENEVCGHPLCDKKADHEIRSCETGLSYCSHECASNHVNKYLNWRDEEEAEKRQEDPYVEFKDYTKDDVVETLLHLGAGYRKISDRLEAVKNVLKDLEECIDFLERASRTHGMSEIQRFRQDERTRIVEKLRTALGEGSRDV